MIIMKITAHKMLAFARNLAQKDGYLLSFSKSFRLNFFSLLTNSLMCVKRMAWKKNLFNKTYLCNVTQDYDTHTKYVCLCVDINDFSETHKHAQNIFGTVKENCADVCKSKDKICQYSVCKQSHVCELSILLAEG